MKLTYKCIAIAIQIIAAIALGWNGGWRVMRASRFDWFAECYDPSLAPNNGWSVCRDDSGRLHVVWTQHAGPIVQYKVYWRYSDDNGRTWSAPLAISKEDMGHAHNGVIACIGNYVGAAWFQQWLDHPNPDSHIIYRQSPDRGRTWKDWWRLSANYDDPHKHEWAMHPSLTMSPNGNGTEPYANVAFIDSSFLVAPNNFWDWHAAYRPVEMWKSDGAGEVVFRKPHGLSDADSRQPDYPSIACRSSDDEAFCVFQDSVQGHSINLFYDWTAGMGGSVRITNDNDHDHLFPCVQAARFQRDVDVWDDSIFVVYQYDDPVLNRWVIRMGRFENNEPEEVVHTEPFRLWRTRFNHDMYRPSIWLNGDSMFMSFVAINSENQRIVCFSYSDDFGRNWKLPIWVTASGADSASIWGSGPDAYIACNVTPPGTTPRQRECRLYVLRRVPWYVVEYAEAYGAGSGPTRLLQKVPGEKMYRLCIISEPEDFIGVDYFNQDTWETIESPGYGKLPAAATDEDGILCVIWFSQDTLFCSYWDPQLRDWTKNLVVFVSESGVKPGRSSVALYPGDVAGMKVAGVAFAVYDTVEGTSRIMFAKVDTGTVILDTIDMQE